MALATVALIVFHELGARLGAVTGQGLMGLVRERFGVRAGLLFSAGLLGAALLAASVLPLATAYSVGEALETALDDRIRDAPVFYGTFAFVVATALRRRAGAWNAACPAALPEPGT
jgi:Mn2+/Fe2+ NRAMP family transporter